MASSEEAGRVVRMFPRNLIPVGISLAGDDQRGNEGPVVEYVRADDARFVRKENLCTFSS